MTQPQSITQITQKIIVSIAGEDEIIDYSTFGLSFDSSESEVLSAIQPFIKEKYETDIMSSTGSWLYKTRKASTSQNIHIIPNSTAGSSSAPSEHALSYLDDKDRLEAYNLITKGCMHVWSKNKLQEDKLKPVLDTFATLAEKDPLFLAHLTSYIHNKLDSKDLKVISTFASSLSDADGTPFSQGSSYNKPNWRIIAQAALQRLDPKLVLRTLKLTEIKQPFGSRPAATHFSKSLKVAATKYIQYREQNPKSLEGIKKAGLTSTMQSLYRVARCAPTKEASQILGWKQKPGFPGYDPNLVKSNLFDFTGLTEVQIAEKIQQEKLKPTAVLGALQNKISPVIAAAILEQSSGDQAVILTDMFEEQGLLKNKEVKKVYEAKIKTAKNCLDRVDRIKAKLDEETQQILKQTKADIRKDTVGDIGKVFLHLDISGSMSEAIEFAKDKGAIIAECIKNPEINFNWGVFNDHGRILERPQTFVKDAFKAALYGVRSGGGTDCLSLWTTSRNLGCDTDVFITDEEHTYGMIDSRIMESRRHYKDPKQVVIIRIGRATRGYRSNPQCLSEQLKRCGIPVVVLDPNQLTESALVAQSIKTAIKGTSAILDEIMAEPLLTLPKWWYAVGG
jgi:hypothetical protein